MEFETSRVKIIEEKCSKNPEKCCREVFIHLLHTKEGINPKTWGITELTAVTEQIEIDIKKVTNYNLLLFYMWI